MKKKIIIIGAGISGLYLAYMLEDKFDITIIEARSRVGGRVYAIDGHDMGPSWVWPHHKNILSLIDELGLEIFPQYTQGYALYDTRDGVEHFTPPPSMPSSRVNGSLGSFIEVIHKSLKSTKVLLSQEVQSVEEIDEGLSVTTRLDTFKSDFAIFTLPPRLVTKIDFTPKLPESLQQKMSSIQTWMGHSAKCVIEFKDAFWREKGLSGFAYSNNGPLGEIHDASTADRAALFGFVNSNAQMDHFDDNVKEQLSRVFQVDSSQIISIHLVDWKEEKYTASYEDRKALSQHPFYGIDTSQYSDKILFSSTEFSFREGGYLEGALIRAKDICKQIG
ncbi:FAD-dependent oxidoreductase [Sulfurimonas sp.]|nr:FAD-dependent oxidoreductase [Sulfurimonas sp.]